MSTVPAPEASQTSTPASKKKNNKKKKPIKQRLNGDPTKENGAEDVVEVAEVGVEGVDAEQPSVNHGMEEAASRVTIKEINGHYDKSARNGHVVLPLEAPDSSTSNAAIGTPKVRSIGDEMDLVDASARLEAMSEEREALRTEVEQLRRSLEDIREKHNDDITAMEKSHAADMFSAQNKDVGETSIVEGRLRLEISTVRAELAESESAREHAESQYQNLLGRVNTIKATLGERLKADKRDLEEAKTQIEELETANEALANGRKGLEDEVAKSQREMNESSKELTSLRYRHNLSQQNWIQERGDMSQELQHLKEEAKAAKEAMGDWEVLAMEERSIRENLEYRIADMEEQCGTQKEELAAAVLERDNNSEAVSRIQRALQEIQEARKRELREMVETTEEQVQALKTVVQDLDSRATHAEASREAMQRELERLAPFEKEIKEKNLLIGKLRHEAIGLNDHLTKALRFLKKAKPEDNIDRQIVTNHFLQFLALDRSDPKKFQILQLIAAILNWNDEQKEQAGLSRPGTYGGSLRLPASPFHRTPSTNSLSTDFATAHGGSKESLADLWTGFLERSAEEGSITDSRSHSTSSSAPRPETHEGTLHEK